MKVMYDCESCHMTKAVVKVMDTKQISHRKTIQRAFNVSPPPVELYNGNSTALQHEV